MLFPIRSLSLYRSSFQKNITPQILRDYFAERKSQSYALAEAKKIVEFVDWIIEKEFSVEDDFGNKLPPAEFKIL